MLTLRKLAAKGERGEMFWISGNLSSSFDPNCKLRRYAPKISDSKVKNTLHLPKCLSIEGWIKMKYIYTMRCYSAIK